MISDPTVSNLTREDIEKWLLGFHAASKTLDADHWVNNYFTTDCTLQYGNMPIQRGLDSTRKYFAGAFPKFSKMEHEIVYFDYLAPRIYQKAAIRYIIEGDSEDQEIEIPGFGMFELKKEMDEIKCCVAEVYLDPSPLAERVKEQFDGHKLTG
ncbi:hypothetical protein K402DRAFT_394997 [Aulographum hederae CBS 113979]|uniref:SnoaL-like domain-containing protein n=1 Tax=Aulographum hederae CBS 113979 TaxID=1176131 RepID=A0A6G1GWW5_9PEZI|nr:hypothetical protein K402DRAFT_394997 [Aulographum hederae CBS 113979]